MIYTDRVIDCETHDHQVVVLDNASNGQLVDRCVKCVRDRIAGDGFCACDCGDRLGTLGAASKYLGQKHRQNAHRADLRALASALGINASLSVKAVQSATTTRARRSDGEKAPRRAQPRRKPQLRISYRKAVEAVAEAIEDGVFEPSRILTPRDQAEGVLRQVLPAKAQEQIEEGLLEQWEAEAA